MCHTYCMNQMQLPIRTQQTQVVLMVRVSPNAKRSGFEGIWNQTHIRIALRAPAVDGKANKALIEFLSDFCGVRQVHIIIKSGISGRLKQVYIECSNKTHVDILVEKLKKTLEL